MKTQQKGTNCDQCHKFTPADEYPVGNTQVQCECGYEYEVTNWPADPNLQFVEDAIANDATFASAGNGQYVVDYRKFEADHEAAARHLAAGGSVEIDDGYFDDEIGDYIDGGFVNGA